MSRPTTELAHLFRQLKAPAAARALPKLADRARAEEWSYEQFAAVLLKTETDSRDSHGGQARIKAARFPARKTLEEFDFAFQASIRRDSVLHLGQLDFLAGKENVVLLGPPDRGSQCFLSIMVDQRVQGRRRELRCEGRFGGPSVGSARNVPRNRTAPSCAARTPPDCDHHDAWRQDARRSRQGRRTAPAPPVTERLRNGHTPPLARCAPRRPRPRTVAATALSGTFRTDVPHGPGRSSSALMRARGRWSSSESWARSGERLSDLLYGHLRMAKEVQLHMWTSVLEGVVELADGRMDGGIRVITRLVGRRQQLAFYRNVPADAAPDRVAAGDGRRHPARGAIGVTEGCARVGATIVPSRVSARRLASQS